MPTNLGPNGISSPHKLGVKDESIDSILCRFLGCIYLPKLCISCTPFLISIITKCADWTHTSGHILQLFFDKYYKYLKFLRSSYHKKSGSSSNKPKNQSNKLKEKHCIP